MSSSHLTSLLNNQPSRSIPVIDAEVRYAVQHEYAQTAVDVVARRTRLAFLNVYAALNALPRVVDIMADELGWSRAERQAQIERAVAYFASMGLEQGSVPIMPRPVPRGWVEKAWEWVRQREGKSEVGDVHAFNHSRARFEPEEVAALAAVFERHAQSMVVDGQVEEVVGLGQLREAVRAVVGYEGVSEKDFEYVLEEAGLNRVEGVDFDQFIEVCGMMMRRDVCICADFFFFFFTPRYADI